jgi:alanine racemase
MRGRLHVDLAALAANYRSFSSAAEAAGGTAGGVVKANAYGLGVAKVAATLQAQGCTEFFVATVEEGAALRAILPEVIIYVFEGATDATVEGLVSNDLVPVLNHPGQLEAWRAHRKRPAAVHIDTGMNRLGFPSEVDAVQFAGVNVTLLLTHLACADVPDNPMNHEQVERFRQAAAAFPGVRTSIGNSAGMLADASRCGDLGRPGVGLYGGNPFSDRANPMRRVAALEGPVLQVRECPAGSPLGYGASYVAPADMRVAVVGLGYADGLPRLISNRGCAAVGGRRCELLGRVSMDLTLVDVTGLDVQAGDWVEMFGDTVSVDEIAVWAETIAYEVLTGIGERVERVYSGD